MLKEPHENTCGSLHAPQTSKEILFARRVNSIYTVLEKETFIKCVELASPQMQVM